ncbi:hypothetical protein [Amycolatopsis sp. CA-230715]|uniref:hypothetical protein n=1 Tax=Amycolatopsis sp. CA-230715 TaxID=2745196 RepID=UPI001C039AC6|nr:hypothetical protein [Amycolatopsis sp. CA-230715]QWF83784.1 hypothetical protein HUW46_07227 [Amycolatopsis sp. CA-230715]
MTSAYGENGGYSYTPEGLNGIVGQLREGAGALDAVAGGGVPVDAGASSAAVGHVLDSVVRMAIASAESMSEAAGKVHSANGAYDDIDNSHAGQLRLNEKRDTPDARREQQVHG